MQPGLYAFAAAAAFVGATTYIGFVEQPARLALGIRAMVREWTQSNRRGSPMLSVLAVVSAILASIEFKTNGDVRWLVGGATILASWPYAYFVMMPVNVWLFAIVPGKAISPVHKLMRDWGLLEWGHALIGFAACCAFAWAIEWPP
jgi:Anthrone oxygenase